MPDERDMIGYGRYQPRVRWPGGARVAVNLHVNYEAGAEYTSARDGRNEPVGEFPIGMEGSIPDRATQSTFEYESRAGFWRIVRVLEEHGVSATMNACAVALEQNPEVAGYLRNSAHEVSCHGWRWEELWTLDREQERDHLHRAVASIERTCGRRPVGWCSRLMQSEHTRDLLAEEGGFLYDSDALNDDFPYSVDVGGRPHLVMPLSFTYNDGRYVLGSADDPVAFGNYLRLGLDELWREGETAPKLMTVSLHPRWSGQAARASAVRGFIEHALNRGEVWFARRDEIARWWLDHAGGFLRVDAVTGAEVRR